MKGNRALLDCTISFEMAGREFERDIILNTQKKASFIQNKIAEFLGNKKEDIKIQDRQAEYRYFSRLT
ncbi:MAG: hypothetical protein SWO11_20180 [Thermodesulfobacteriota bacterium]|nr:hypothetical protein [Thermodesulfobacteriota bacterium]